MEVSINVMQKIELNNALPRVFAGMKDLQSQVWHQHVVFERGKRYLVSAQSGGGKSSLCAYMYGYRLDFLGEISFDGMSVRDVSIAQWCDIRKHSIAYLPQELRLFPELTAMENVEMKNRLTHHKSEKEIKEMFDRLGIADKCDSLVAKMSVGQQQRVAIVRTLCQPCDFYLLDEPVSHLDGDNNQIVASMVEAEAQCLGAGVIATSVGNDLKIEAEEVLHL